jgi:mannitol/fructose-specific phosphotransferase system IIA component (Ntr-type)
MRLRDLLDDKSVKIGLESVDKEECFEEMVDILVRAGRVSDRAATLKAIQSREDQGTTGIGTGIAVPHAKHESIPSLMAALGISSEGIEFEAIDSEPVHLVVLLLANISEPGPHLQALVEIARLVKIPGFYRKVVEAGSISEILDILDSEE